jgi:SNF2 family DNA or RNA helicase
MLSSSSDSSQNASLFLAPEWVPHEFQRRGIEWIITHPESALFWSPGLGKTSTTLGALVALRGYGYNYRMLVLAPLRVAQTTWLNEPCRWRQFQGLKVGLAHGPNKQAVLMDPQYDIVVLNYDGIAWAAPLLARHNPFQMLVCDELTKLKHTNTQRFKRLKVLLPDFQFRLGLTGTPAANGLLDLFGQMYVLDLGYRLGKYVTHYRLNYFYQKPHDEFNWYITPENAARIHAKVADLAMYIQPEEVLKLPDIVHIDLPVTLSHEAFDQYKQLEVLCILQLQETVLSPANAGVLTSKLRQLTGGAVYSNSEHDYEEIHTAKLDALDDLIEEMAGEPLLVAYNFSHEVERILKRQSHALVIRGGMTGAAVQRIIDAWNSGEVPLLCVQSDAAAHGLNIQFGGSALCWFSQTYNLEVYIQLIARLYRQGQTSVVRVYHILAEKTIDKHIRKVLDNKDQTQNELFVALRTALLQSATK